MPAFRRLPIGLWAIVAKIPIHEFRGMNDISAGQPMGFFSFLGKRNLLAIKVKYKEYKATNYL